MTGLFSHKDFLLSTMAWLQLVLAALAALIFVQGRPVDRAIRLLNESGSKLEVYWVNSQTGDRVLMSTPVVHSGAVMPLNSFVGHEFEIHEVPSTKTGECKDQTCHSGSFVVSENDDQAVRILEGFEMVISDSKTQAKDEAEDIVDRCQAQAQKIIEESGGSADGALQAMELLSSCVESGVAHKLELANEEIAFQASVREDMAELLENYTCVDDSLDTTEDIDTSSFTDRDEVTHVVHIKHDRPSSKIHVVENFITIEECDAMEKAASRTLHRATVADGKGGSEYSPNRKAMQAGITVDWEKEEEGDPIARLSRRVYDYTNFVLDLGIEEHGQEDLMSIQYFGRGKNNTEEPPDRYTPHCTSGKMNECLSTNLHANKLHGSPFHCRRRRLHGPPTQDRDKNGDNGNVLQFAHVGRSYELSKCWRACQACGWKRHLFLLHQSRNENDGYWLYRALGLSRI
jgi:hypothetical protein